MADAPVNAPKSFDGLVGGVALNAPTFAAVGLDCFIGGVALNAPKSFAAEEVGIGPKAPKSCCCCCGRGSTESSKVGVGCHWKSRGNTATFAGGSLRPEVVVGATGKNHLENLLFTADSDNTPMCITQK